MYNLGFEGKTDVNGLPDKWVSTHNPDFTISQDTGIKYQGKASVKIESINPYPESESLTVSIPLSLQGKVIEVGAYLKLENLKGAGGIILCLEKENKMVKYENMMNKGLKGTIDWKEYSVALPIPPGIDNITIGVIISGSGVLWTDDFSIKIDGKDLKEKATKKQQFSSPAKRDNKEFANASGIEIHTVNHRMVDNLSALCCIWGFLKYYHPAVGSGKYNWDYELFRIMPRVMNSENISSRDSILTDWIGGLGAFSTKILPPMTFRKIKVKPDLEWMDRYDFSDELYHLLKKIVNAGRGEDHYYVQINPLLRNPVFTNENEYASFTFPDQGYRLLCFFRYWNIIQYYYPYKYLIEEDWKQILTEFIPRFIAIKNEMEYVRIILELVTRINDTHATVHDNRNTLNRLKGVNRTPLKISFIENKAVVTAFYDENIEKKSGLAIGDIIVSINDIRVEDRVREMMKITSASNYAGKQRDIAWDLLRTNDSVIVLGFIRDGDPYCTRVVAYPLEYTSNSRLFFNSEKSCFDLIGADLGYLYLGQFTLSSLSDLWTKIEPTTGLIIDLRCYPKEPALYDLGRYLMPGKTPFARFSYGSITCPGMFTNTILPAQVGVNNKKYYKGKIAILVNEQTQSQAEFTAMAFRVAPRAKVFGSMTAGADGDISTISLPGGIFTSISGIGVYYPDGRETQRIGIVPDVEIKPTVKGTKEGRDEVLEKAIEWIRKNE